MATDRARLVVALDDDTLDLWRTLARVHGVTLSALIEAIGRQIMPDKPNSLLRRAISDARLIMAERNDRRIPDERPPETF